MSQFPNVNKYSIRTSEKILKKISCDDVGIFVLKKSKTLYLYDIDNNKYIDFSLKNGEILETHAPLRLTKFIKNALSLGLSSVEHPNKFYLKSIQLWKDFTKSSYINYYSSIISGLLEIIRILEKSKITIGYNNLYLLNLLNPLKGLVNLVDISEKYEHVDIIVFEPFSDQYKPWAPTNISEAIIIKIHSRFLFRNQLDHTPIFEKNFLHLIHTSPFGGKPLCVIAGTIKLPISFPSFDEGILYLEGIKYLKLLQKKTFPKFHHPKFISFDGFSVCHEYLDSNFFAQHGIYLKNNMLFFSPLHTFHNMRRLHKALNLYFNDELDDIPDQK